MAAQLVAESQNLTGSPRWGTMWSTTVAAVVRPSRSHWAQSGWAAR